MRRRLLAWPILCFLMVVEACTGDQRALPTEVTPNPTDIAASAAPTTCPSPAAVDKQIIALVPVGKRIIAAVDFDLIVIAYKLGQVKPARTAMFQLWAKVVKAYFAGQLTGGMSSNTQAATLALGKAFYCNLGLDGSTLSLGSGGNDPNNVVAVVFPATTTQTVTTGNGNSGLQIPPTALNAPVTVTISLIPGTFPEFTGPLQTKLDQFGPFFQYTVSPEGSVVDFITVGVCTSDPQLPVSRVHVAHNVGTGLEILPLVPTPNFLAGCPISTGMAPQRPSAFELAQAHDYRGALSAVGSMVGDLFVMDAYAGGGSIGIGGKTKSFSPFGLVDTVIAVVANPPTSQQARTGSPVASPPSVTAQTLGLKTPLPGVGVTFSIVQGAGTLTGASTTTNASGVATVGSWTVGVGTNIVNAVGKYPTPPSGVNVTVGDTAADTAFGGDVIPYLDTGYRYLLASPLIPTQPGDTAGFFKNAFSDVLFSTGNAAFGSGSVQNQSCPLDNTVVTHWANILGGGSDTTGMLLRKTFLWPATGTGQTVLQLGVAIDNDIQVYVNGTDVTSTVQNGTVGADGFVQHEGCAAQDSFLFSVSDALLLPGNNLLAVRARDRGVVAYVDARLSVPNNVLQNRITTPIRAGSQKNDGSSKLSLPLAPAPSVRLKQ